MATIPLDKEIRLVSIKRQIIPWRNKTINKTSFRPFSFAIILIFAALAFIKSPDTVYSSAAPDEGPQGTSNALCLTCHQTANVYETLPSGEQLDLFVDGNALTTSIHGIEQTDCVDCHTSYSGYPHPERDISSLRDFISQENESCADCHEEKAEEDELGIHHQANSHGNLEAAVCSDCHGAHAIRPQRSSPENVTQVCSTCHSEVYNLYQESVHGAALIGEGNPDVPSCVDCHGSHAIESSTTSQFHLFSPQICADCHADEALAKKYDLNPNVFETYISDFHGTTVTLFEQISPDQETNKPVCIDCHSVHDIRSSDDPQSSVVKENLLATCQRCHPDASEDFPDAWLSHYQPSWEKTPVVSTVNLFYKIVLPATVIGMLVFVVPDWAKRLRKRFARQNNDE